MMNTMLKFLATALIAVTVSTPALAQAACADRAVIAKQLETVHKETQQAIGLSSGGGVMEVFTSAAGTWTVLMTFPNGKTCVVAAGEAWEHLPAKVIGPTA
ncbi:MAG: hypothetical protein MJE12_25055 [Alphaproteobacteria bacterium]|nr:hypothetical protein [Alphaproteobacteria bacterium]